MNQSKTLRTLYVSGIISIIAGALDPMEGSIIIALGSILLAVSSWLMHDRHKHIFLFAATFIFIGVFSLWFVSSLGGYEPRKEWWWNFLILPYPLGWLLSIVLLIVRGVNKKKNEK